MAYTGGYPTAPVLDCLQFLSAIPDQPSCYILSINYDRTNNKRRLWIDWRIHPCLRRYRG
jgi:hypothetical protein